MSEVHPRYEKMTLSEMRSSFSGFFKRLGYNTHPDGHPIASTANPQQLSFVNCSMAPYIAELETNHANGGYSIHEATVQPAVRLNSHNEEGLLANPQWITSFDMAGVITSTTPMFEVTQQVNNYLTREVGVEARKLHYIVNPDDTVNLRGLLKAGIPSDRIHFQKENNKILVDWDYGVPGLAGTGITICYVDDEAQLNDINVLADRQFLNIISITKYNDGAQSTDLVTPFIDMGFGVERLLSLLQETSPFELGDRKEIKEMVVKAAKTKIGIDQVTDQRILTLTDHLHTAKLLLDQGIKPSRRDATKRGHLLAKLLKNALQQAYILDIDAQFIADRLSQHTAEIQPEIDRFMGNVEKVGTNIESIRLSWLLTKAGQKGTVRPRFSSLDMIQDFYSYVEKKYFVPPKITLRFLRKIDREVFYLSGFHERYYPYPTIEQEEVVANTNVEEIVALLKKEHAEEILDIGCGKGRHSIALAKRHFRVTALDFDPASIRAFKRKIEVSGITNIEAAIADGFQLEKSVEPGSMDAALIFYTSVLAAGERKEDLATLAQIKKVLKPGGVFMWSVTNLEGVKAFWRPGEAQYYKNTRDETIIYTEKRDLVRDRIAAHPVAYIVAEPVFFEADLNAQQRLEIQKFRFTIIETDIEKRIVYKDEMNEDKLKSAQIATSEEGLLSVQPYTQSEITNVLTQLGFTDIAFHKGIKPADFDVQSEGSEFDIVVTAKNKE